MVISWFRFIQVDNLAQNANFKQKDPPKWPHWPQIVSGEVIEMIEIVRKVMYLMKIVDY